jgi:hypothetical protein
MGDANMPFTDEEIQAVWNKGKVTYNDPKVWRKDQCDAWIHRNRYGNRDSKWGWEIDHINPNGGDSLANLRPLQWKNNLAKSEGKLKCVVTSADTDNVDK